MASSSTWVAVSALILLHMASLLPCPSSSLGLRFPTSAISVAPAGLPLPFSSSPLPSPDTSPLFPTPATASPSQADSSLPTIPASPSPPDPNHTPVAALAPGPETPFAPHPATASSSVALCLSGPPTVPLFMGFMAFWLVMQAIELRYVKKQN